MAQGISIPTNSVEFETLTTEPGYGDPKEFDTDPFRDLNGVLRPTEEHVRILGHLNRDFRLGNLDPNLHDVEWVEDMIGLGTALHSFRNGSLSPLAPLAFGRAAETIEVSQSVRGFFRRNSRTFHSVSDVNENVNQGNGGFFGKLFGKKGKGGY